MYKHSEKQASPSMKSGGVHAVSYTNITLCRPKQSSNKLKNQKHRRENYKKLMKINIPVVLYEIWIHTQKQEKQSHLAL